MQRRGQIHSCPLWSMSSSYIDPDLRVNYRISDPGRALGNWVWVDQ